jgi:endogenous inhibitor of DNA gyrase (YacG/DUF329 family)
MSYDKKLLEEFRKYNAVTCTICKKRNRKNWNIYSANTFCSQECISKGIDLTNPLSRTEELTKE